MTKIILIFCLSLFFLIQSKQVANVVGDSKSSKVKITISWEYKNFPKRFSQMKIYEPVSGKPLGLWLTASEKDLSQVPISREIKNSLLNMKRGSSKRFVLVLKNETNKPLFFFAAPHQVQPAEYSLGFKFRCLCINHAFKVGPKETWYRVVQLRVSPHFVGNSLNIKHSLVSITEKRMKSFSLH